jgi:hypothetical protein
VGAEFPNRTAVDLLQIPAHFPDLEPIAQSIQELCSLTLLKATVVIRLVDRPARVNADRVRRPLGRRSDLALDYVPAQNS